MSFWIDGWIEVNRLSTTDDSWQDLIRLGSLIDLADAVSEQLFGLSKRAVDGSISIPAVAAGRGVPSNPSKAVSAELAHIADHERQFGAGEYGGHTHMTWREIKAAGLDSAVVAQSQWSLVFDLVRHLEQDYRFADDRIRFIVWFIW